MARCGHQRSGRERLSHLLMMKYRAGYDCIHDSFQLTRRQNQPVMCRVFFVKKKLGINAVYGISYPLGAAIITANPDVVRTLLKLGANPDGPTYLSNSIKRPIAYMLSYHYGWECAQIAWMLLKQRGQLAPLA
jgi:hypothetical protein